MLRASAVGLAALLLLTHLAAASSPAPAPRAVAPRGPLPAEEAALVSLFRRTSPSVVYITTLERVVNLWTMNVREVPSGTGSGFVWDVRGNRVYIVTNWHVVAGAKSAQVRLADQRTFRAQFIGASPENDLAVLAIEVKDDKPDPIPLGSSRELQVGQRVYAIGNPFGFDHTLTQGIISALDRSIDGDRGPIHQLIQTDAAINPGNSGGPLLDSAGRLVGVNTSIYSPSGASAGIGFAIPADTVNRVVPEIIAHGHYRRAMLGVVSNERLSRLVTRRLGVSGLLILEVQPGSPADQAGLRGSQWAADGSLIPGDIVQSIDGQPVDGLLAFDRLLAPRRPGERLRLGLWREGQRSELAVTLAGQKGPLR